MEYDFTEIEDGREEFVAVPPGIYEVRVAETRESPGRDRTPHWGLRLEVTEGDYAGKTAAWDWLVWSERAAPRVKRVLRAFGVDVSGVVRLEHEDLLDRRVRVEVILEEREDPVSGKTFVRNRVPYDGYRALDDLETPDRNGAADFISA